MRLVIVESPYAGAIGRNISYALECIHDCLLRGEAPMAGHLLYPRVLFDTQPADRSLGIEAHIAWVKVSDATVVYTDRGVSDGMRLGIDAAHKAGRVVEYRTLPAWRD
jgi:hypothetical protein